MLFRSHAGAHPSADLSEGTVELEPRPVTGVRLHLGGLYVPEALDVVEGYGGAEGEIAGYLGSPRVHLAVRAGGRHLWGTYAWFDAAWIGGRNARAYRNHRWAGDSSLYGSAELRFWFAPANTPVVPIRVGVFGLVESGRVWLEGEDSSTWHTSWGGGLLFQPMGSPVTVHATVATGDEGTRFRFGSGFGF